MAARYTAKEIWANIQKSDVWLYRSILAIYNRQTGDEQQSALSKYDNHVGFNAVDARPMSRIAEHLKAKGWISSKDRAVAIATMRKYAGQLAAIARDKV